MFERFETFRSRLQALALLAFAIACGWFALESMAYRSGAYLAMAEPDSNTGAVVTALKLVELQYRPNARNILVLGDSRVGEGFSPQHAAGGDLRFNFINVAVPGSTARTWYYLLREIDRRGYRYAAVVVGTVYNDTDAALRDNWPLDLAHAAPLIGLRDAISFPASFESPSMRERARHAVFFPALALRQDTLAMFEAPVHRIRKVFVSRPAYLTAVASYPGREETMPRLHFDNEGRDVVDWSSIPSARRAELAGYMREVALRPASVSAANDAFSERWLGAAARLARRQQARFILYPVPRGPYPNVLLDPKRVSAALRKLQRDSGVVVLPPDLLAELEAPAYFFDTLHSNRGGRERTGTLVGARVRTLLSQGAPR